MLESVSHHILDSISQPKTPISVITRDMNSLSNNLIAYYTITNRFFREELRIDLILYLSHCLAHREPMKRAFEFSFARVFMLLLFRTCLRPLGWGTNIGPGQSIKYSYIFVSQIKRNAWLSCQLLSKISRREKIGSQSYALIFTWRGRLFQKWEGAPYLYNFLNAHE